MRLQSEGAYLEDVNVAIQHQNPDRGSRQIVELVIQDRPELEESQPNEQAIEDVQGCLQVVQGRITQSYHAVSLGQDAVLAPEGCLHTSSACHNLRQSIRLASLIWENRLRFKLFGPSQEGVSLQKVKRCLGMDHHEKNNHHRIQMHILHR